MAEKECSNLDDGFARSLAANVKELIEAGAEAKREEIARNITRIVMEGQQERIKRAIDQDRAEAGRKDPEGLEQALQDAMSALAQCEALFTGITHMLNTGDGEPISLSMIGADLADAAHAKADQAGIDAADQRDTSEADHA